MKSFYTFMRIFGFVILTNCSVQGHRLFKNEITFFTNTTSTSFYSTVMGLSFRVVIRVFHISVLYCASICEDPYFSYTAAFRIEWY